VAEIIGGDRRMTLDETGQTAMTQFEKPHLVQQLVISRPKHFIRAW
jgi:hypothetical protein